MQDIITLRLLLQYATQAASGFTNTNIRCLKHCLAPPSVTGTSYSTDAEPYTIYSTAHFTCQAEYYCLEIEAWSQPSLTCYRYCGALPTFTNANRVETSAQPYTRITEGIFKYQCKRFYHHNWDYGATASYQY